MMVKLADLRDGDVFMIDNPSDVPYGAKVHRVVSMDEDEVAVLDRNGHELLSGSPDRMVRVDRKAAAECSHADYLSAECEGWENPTEPLSIRVTCSRCGKHVDVRVEDPSLLDWED